MKLVKGTEKTKIIGYVANWPIVRTNFNPKQYTISNHHYDTLTKLIEQFPDCILREEALIPTELVEVVAALKPKKVITVSDEIVYDLLAYGTNWNLFRKCRKDGFISYFVTEVGKTKETFGECKNYFHTICAAYEFLLSQEDKITIYGLKLAIHERMSLEGKK